MMRNEWEFQFSTDKLVEAARAKRDHHKARFDFWKAAMGKVMDEVKESGLEVAVSEAGMSYTQKMSASAGFGPQVMVRNDLQRRLTECHQKIMEHTGKVREYDGWVFIFEHSPNKTLELNADDYLFFFAKDTTDSE